MIALSMVPGIGSIGSKRILQYTGSAEAVFACDGRSLKRIPGVGSLLASRILDKKVIENAAKELEYISRNGIKCLYYTEENYPAYLKFCEDAPLVLYVRGELKLEGKKVLSVVGTRRPSVHGLENCNRLIRDLAGRHSDLVIVSGLAYGIDYCAHLAALESGINTIAVLGHGMKYMYPAYHRKIARRIESCGALLSDFPSGERPAKNNFIKRNRIIGGLSEATVVVESGVRGGALITADLANSYNREVFAFPGQAADATAAGCNRLIKSHKAALIENFRDVEYMLGWDSKENPKQEIQGSIFPECTIQEKKILEVLKSEGESSVDLICFRSGLPVGKLHEVLLNLEFTGLIKALPGDYYRLVNL